MRLLDLATRFPFVLGAWNRFPVGSVETRVHYGVFPYPNYAYGVYWSSMLASRLGLPAITVVEMGVAGGRGLIALENASSQIEKVTGVRVDVVGFDSGEGMPAPVDFRDVPQVWGEGFYKMEPEKLRSRLKRAQLMLGDVHKTIPDWMAKYQRSPIGFIAFDLDYYSSTKAAFHILTGPETSHLPRVYCYFDDLAGNDLACMSDLVGEHLAIKEFNAENPDRKLCKIEQLRLSRPRWENWQDRMYAFHNFAHPQYNTLVIPRTKSESQLPLR